MQALILNPLGKHGDMLAYMETYTFILEKCCCLSKNQFPTTETESARNPSVLLMYFSAQDIKPTTQDVVGRKFVETHDLGEHNFGQWVNSSDIRFHIFNRRVG